MKEETLGVEAASSTYMLGLGKAVAEGLGVITAARMRKRLLVEASVLCQPSYKHCVLVHRRDIMIPILQTA